ncbi:MAG: prolyl oligopeptidase family serine peptidase [Acidobacteriaceae bacterium]
MPSNAHFLSASFIRRAAPALALVALLPLPSRAQAQTRLQKPPLAAVRPVSDNYYGQTVVDPYRWLENLKSPDVKSWMRGQADYTRAVFDSMPGRKAFAAEMDRYINAPDLTISDVQLAGPYTFYRMRRRSDNQASLYVRKASGGPGRLLLDVEALSKPGHHISLDQYSPSYDGKYVVVGLSAGGSELQTAHIFETATDRELPEQFPRYEGGIFSPHNKTFYYLQLQKLAPNESPLDKYRRPMEYSHVLGTPVTGDKVVLGEGISPEIAIADYQFPIATPIPGSRYALAIVEPGVGTFRDVYIGDPSALVTHKGWRKVADLKDKVTDFALQGNSLYLVSFDGTMNGKLLRVNAADPDLSKAQVVVPPSDLVFSGGFIGSDVVHQASDALYLRVIQKGQGRVLRVPYAPNAKFTMLTQPGDLQVDSVSTAQNVSGALLRLESWTQPGDYYRYDSATSASVATGIQPPNQIDPNNLEAHEVEARAADGTMIPLSIIYKKGLALNGHNPTMLIGYGAYGDAIMPGYPRREMAWMERGGILAVAHVRGGGELGEAWHLAGYKATKPNTWNDFIATAEYLISHNYTNPAHLGIWSGSAGGILIGRAITTRPDLFAAALDTVPCSDMVREETGANGPANIPEFGSTKTEAGFKALYAMSAYYHVEPGVKYPAVLVTAGANDPRVDPWQGAKMAARLEADTASGRPVLFRVNYDAGHGLTDTVHQQVSDWTDYFTFLYWNFGDANFQPAALRQPSSPSSKANR